MKALRPQILYFLFWIAFFVFSKIAFISYHHLKTAGLTTMQIVKVFIFGLRLDASFTGYICILPFICFFIHSASSIKTDRLIHIYTYILIVIFSFLTVADLELYKAWGFRLDATPLQYFKNPKEMAASVGASPVVLLLGIFIVLSVFFIWLYIRFFRLRSINNTPDYRGQYILALLIIPVLFIPIRGGLQQIPVNQSDVYFSENRFANHAAINVPWNVMQSLLNKNLDTSNPYQYMEQSKAKVLVDSLYTKRNVPLSLLKIQRPNIIFIILESYTAKYIGCLGGEKGVTPRLDSIAAEGMLFTHIYASGDRSEKGLVALLSGYPTQTTTSIIFDPAKSDRLPNLQKSLQEAGYHSGYYYGGELAFANIKSYLLNAGYQKLVSKFDFSSRDYNSKWGVHDHLLLNRLSHDLAHQPQPFFETLFTLSSHEPYEIPIPKVFPGSDEQTQFKNSFYYTDQAIGNFMNDARKQPWWDSTLVILVADHGHRFPGDDPNYVPSKFRIPLILSGGALKITHSINNNIGSQTDIAATILQQMGLVRNEYRWSKNLLDSTNRFAFYIFNDGFGFVTSAGAVAFDNISHKVIYRDPGVPENQLTTGKAYMQMSFQDFLDK